MKKHFARVISIALAFTLALLTPGIIPVKASSEDFDYYEENGEIIIYGYIGAGGAVEIPETIEGMPVVGVESWTFDSAGTISVSIPKYVRMINADSFENCCDLEEITVDPENVYFSDQDGVLFNKNKQKLIAYPQNKPGNTYTVPESVKKIEYAAFEYNINLETIVIPGNVESIGEYAFYESSLQYVNLNEGLKIIELDAFCYCYYISSIDIPSSVEKIGDSAFYCCTALASVNLSEGLKIIDDNAFFGCYDLETINIPSSVTKIGDDTFYDTPWYNNYSESDFFIVGNGILLAYLGSDDVVTIPDGVTQIGAYAFKYATCTQVNLPASLESIGYNAFYDAALTGIVIPESVVTIEDYAFGYCQDLASVTIPDSVTSIGSDAFYGTPWLDDYTDNNGFVIVGDGILIGYTGSDTVLNIPEGVTRIGAFAFEYGPYTQINLPSSLKSIGKHAFYGCDQLTEIEIPEGVVSIEDRAFMYCQDLASITIPDTVTDIGYDVFYCTEWLYGASDADGFVIAGNGILLSYIGTEEVIDIPQGVTRIIEEVFANNECTQVNIPDSVISIGDYAFAGCYYLTDIDIPASVQTIGYGAFMDCYRLSNVVISGATSLGEYVFDYCLNLLSVTIPDSVTSIGDGSFCLCFALTIYGGPNSYARAHARREGIPYVISATFTVTFDSQGGSDVSSVTADYDTAVTEPTAPTKEGYTFGGWYTDSACATAWDFADDKVTDDITLYAGWVANSYTVTFDSQGGSDVSSVTADYDTAVTEPTAPTKEGYTFGGWYTDSACATAWDFADNKVTDNITLYAKWTLNSYTVTFDSQGGSDVSSVTADYDTSITEPAAPTKEGHTFGGWYTDSACATAWDFADNKVIGDTTLYAKWTKDEKTPDPDTGDAIYVVLMAFLAASLCITAVVYKKVKR